VNLIAERENKLELVSFQKKQKTQVDLEIGRYLEHLIVERIGKAELHLA
jgi:hypothetical protein